MEQEKHVIFELLDKWPSAFVARSEVGRFSGGLLSGKSLANHDSMGTGPARIKCGGKVAYRTADLVDWLKERCQA